MDALKEKLFAWLKEILISGIMDNFSRTFTNLNSKVGEVTNQLAQSPTSFEPGVFSMIRNISENVIMPIAGLILTFIACYELIQLIIAHNNLANFETWIFFKWVFKTFVAVTLISNTFNITLAVFDVTSYVISQSGGIIQSGTAVDASAWNLPAEPYRAVSVQYHFGPYLRHRIWAND